jgi:hypothetical protein
MSCSSTPESKVKESLEKIYNELNNLGYDLIDYTNSFSEIYENDIRQELESRPIGKMSFPSEAIQKIIEGFKELGGTSIDLLSPYGDIDFESESRTSNLNDGRDIIARYNKVAMNKAIPDPRTPQELIARYEKLNRG